MDALSNIYAISTMLAHSETTRLNDSNKQNFLCVLIKDKTCFVFVREDSLVAYITRRHQRRRRMQCLQAIFTTALMSYLYSEQS